MEFCIDNLNRDFIEGWAFDVYGVERIEVFVNGFQIGATELTVLRPDLKTAFPSHAAAERSGFFFPFADKHFENVPGRVKLKIVPCSGPCVETAEIEIANIGNQALVGAESCFDRLRHPAPFPRAVLAALLALRGCVYYDRPWTAERIEGALEDIDFLVRRGSRTLPGLYPYLSYLKSLWAKFVLVRSHFPRVANLDSDGKVAIAACSRLEEAITIAHHLYVLSRNGVHGPLAEFGCCNGYSTSLLSHACFELGARMQVFDSFAGLPHSESTYYHAGEFKESFSEIKRSVTEFGRIESVAFHRGFFADTLPASDVTPMCIYMDVDRASSSRDVMTILNRLPARSCVFSHACSGNSFVGDGIVSTGGPDDAIPAIIEAFQMGGRKITGSYLAGNTGAFWDKSVSWPVLPTSAVLRLLEIG